MTGKQLLLACLDNKPVSRSPWVPYTGVQIGSLKNYSASEMLRDGEKLLECLKESNRQYSPDGQPVVFDLQIEAEILGCGLHWDEKSPPTVSSHPLDSTKDIPEHIPQKDEGRIPLILDVMNKFKAEAGETTALYGLVCGPFTLASHLRSTNLFLDMYDDEEYVKKLIDYTSGVCIAMSRYYMNAGMDVIGVVDPLVSQISPDMFTTYLAGPFKRIFASIRENGGFSSIFVCGDATKNIEVMCRTTPDCLSVDENIDLIEAKKITDAYDIVISGNLQLTVTMLLGNQKDNQKAALDLLDSAGPDNFILAPGCDIPYDVPAENIIGIGQAVQNIDATRRFLSSYTKQKIDIDVEMPDYGSLDHTLIEVLTVDSSTCAACGYMKAAADDMKAVFGSQVEVIERKITEMENIARLELLGVANLPAIVIDGEVKYVSLIPNRRELENSVNEALSLRENK